MNDTKEFPLLGAVIKILYQIFPNGHILKRTKEHRKQTNKQTKKNPTNKRQQKNKTLKNLLKSNRHLTN